MRVINSGSLLVFQLLGTNKLQQIYDWHFDVVGCWGCLPFYKDKNATYTATLLLRMSYCSNYSCKWPGMLSCKQQLHGWNCIAMQHCLSVRVVCVEWACVCGIVMWTKMVGRRQRGYCGISQHLAASTGIGTGDKIHCYIAILRGDSSLIVTIQMCTDMAMISCSVLSLHISSQKSLDNAFRAEIKRKTCTHTHMHTHTRPPAQRRHILTGALPKDDTSWQCI